MLAPGRKATTNKDSILKSRYITLPKKVCLVKAFDYVDHNKLWKILKEMGISDYLTCFLRNLLVGQEAAVRTGHGTTDWFQIEKEYVKAVYCHPTYLTYMQSTS